MRVVSEVLLASSCSGAHNSGSVVQLDLRLTRVVWTLIVNGEGQGAKVSGLGNQHCDLMVAMGKRCQVEGPLPVGGRLPHGRTMSPIGRRTRVFVGQWCPSRSAAQSVRRYGVAYTLPAFFSVASEKKPVIGND